MKIFLLLVLGSLFLAACAQKPALPSEDINARIMQIVQQMPLRGGYSTKPEAWQALQKSITLQKDEISVTPNTAQPSFCSAATYVVFIDLISQLQKEGRVHLSSDNLNLLLVQSPRDQEDGTGVWGRWNANGPGTARLFWQLGLGRNFTEKELDRAKPGDFLKIYWSDEIGAKEKGHSVIFTGLDKDGQLCYWSANTSFPNEDATGMGIKCVPRTKIHHLVFSRLEKPGRLNWASEFFDGGQYRDLYLQSLMQKDSSEDEMYTKIGCKKTGDCP